MSAGSEIDHSGAQLPGSNASHLDPNRLFPADQPCPCPGTTPKSSETQRGASAVSTAPGATTDTNRNGPHLARPHRSPVERLGGHVRDLLIRCFPIHARTRSGLVVPIWNRTQRRVYERVFVEDIYPLGRYNGLVAAVEPRVLDIGSHTGLFALSVADRWPRARIHLFEPVPHLIRRIADLARLNGLLNRWRIEPAAVDRDSGEATLYLTRTSLGASLLRSKAATLGLGRAIRVPTVGLNAYCASLRLDGCDIIKLDAEGNELPILDSALSVFATARLIFVRVFPPLSTRQAVAARLAPLGFAEALEDYRGGDEHLFVRR